jgi:hypothetical protein
LLREPISRETWDDAATDEADEHEQRGNAEPVAEFSRRGDTDRLEMDKQIAQEQQRKRAKHR